MKLIRSELCQWLRDNSSGVYRSSAQAADEIEHLSAESASHFSRAVASEERAQASEEHARRSEEEAQQLRAALELLVVRENRTDTAAQEHSNGQKSPAPAGPVVRRLRPGFSDWHGGRYAGLQLEIAQAAWDAAHERCAVRLEFAAAEYTASATDNKFLTEAGREMMLQAADWSECMARALRSGT